MHLGVLPAGISVHSMYAWCRKGPEEGVNSFQLE